MSSPRHAHPPRLSPKESLIVELLLRDAELYGLQLVAASRGRLKRGTVYVTLGRMEDKGFIASREEAPPADEGPGSNSPPEPKWQFPWQTTLRLPP